MLPFGWGAGDVIKLLEMSAKLYTAFQDANKNSTRQVQILVQEFGRFHAFLGQLRGLLVKYGKPLPFGFDDFQKTLKECEEFVTWYSDRLIDRKKSIQKGWATIKFVWDDKDVERLRKQVAGHVQSLHLYINYLNLEAQFEANASAAGSAIDYLSVPAAGKETLDSGVRISRPRDIQRQPSISEDFAIGEQTTIKQSEELYHEILGFSQYLKHKAGQTSPRAQSDPFSAERSPILSGEDRDEALLNLLKEVDAALGKAQVLVNEQRAAETQQDNVSPDPQTTKIVHTPHGSPEIRVSGVLEDMWGSSLGRKGLQRADTRATFDSGISEMYAASSSSTHRTSTASDARDSEVLFENPWNNPPATENRPGYGSWKPEAQSRTTSSQLHRPDSISSSSVFSVSTVSSDLSIRSNSLAGPAATPGTTPLPSPTDVSRSRSIGSLSSVHLPPAALDWELLSADALIEYSTDQGPRKPTECTISKRNREQGGLVIRATLKNKGSIYHECSATEPPIPFAVNGLRNQNETYLSFMADRSNSFNPPSIRRITYTLKSENESWNLQSAIYGKRLEYSRNIKIVKSDKHDAECRNQCLRLFSQDGILTLLFYTNTRNEGKSKDKSCWIEESHTAFERIPENKASSSSEKLHLDFSKHPEEHAESKQRTKSNASESIISSRFSLHRSPTTSSVGSTASKPSVSTATVTKKSRLKWLEIEFKSRRDRQEFVEVWRKFCRPLMDFS